MIRYKIHFIKLFFNKNIKIDLPNIKNEKIDYENKRIKEIIIKESKRRKK